MTASKDDALAAVQAAIVGVFLPFNVISKLSFSLYGLVDVALWSL